MIVPHGRCVFQGSYVALPTPFRDGEVDWRAGERAGAFGFAPQRGGADLVDGFGHAASHQACPARVEAGFATRTCAR